MNKDLLIKYIRKQIAVDLDSCSLVALSGSECVQALWPLNESFRPQLSVLTALPYTSSFEKAADAAIEAMVFKGDQWRAINAQTWRVLFERHTQAIMLSQLKANEPLIPIPEQLPERCYQDVVLLFLLHQMQLPFPLLDQSDLEVFASNQSIPMRKQ